MADTPLMAVNHYCAHEKIVFTSLICCLVDFEGILEASNSWSRSDPEQLKVGPEARNWWGKGVHINLGVVKIANSIRTPVLLQSNREAL